ncbi:MAG: phosphate ABC transporter substrate-binding protein [Candidatus Omnitrophica bacterium]|nr:phosphate ABC transporter substrate-binding protein [Candidatus Omnitrophota bacterium]
MIKKIIFLLIAILFISIPISKAQKLKNSIQIKGSDTMVNLVQAWSERFMQKNPAVFIAVTGGGSGTGIASLINGSCDIASSSREMKKKEIELAKSKGINPYEVIVALDGVAVVVNPKNPVEKLTLSELKDIFTGKINNWKQVGGEDRKIVVLSREVNSGTYIYFKEHVLKREDGTFEEFSASSLLLPSSQAICEEVSYNESAIGYYGMGYLNPKNKPLAIATDKDSKYILPTIENVISREYPISRPLFFYTNGYPQGLIKEFLDFVLSDEGQRIVLEVDFVPIKKN